MKCSWMRKRANYDRFGHAAAGGGGFEGGFGDFGGFGDILICFSVAVSAGTAARRPQKGADLRFNLSISFEEAAFGAEKDITIPRTENCSTCDGSGAEPGTYPSNCSVCGGTGQVRMSQNTPLGMFQTIKTCHTCQGTGKVVTTPCRTCQGRGKVRRNRTIHLHIPPEWIPVPASGGREGRRDLTGSPGDLYVFIQVRPHQHFQRHNDDVIYELPVSIVQQLWERKLRFPPWMAGEAQILKDPRGYFL